MAADLITAQAAKVDVLNGLTFPDFCNLRHVVHLTARSEMGEHVRGVLSSA